LTVLGQTAGSNLARLHILLIVTTELWHENLLVGQQHKVYQYVEGKGPLWLNELKDNQLMKPGEEI
jgi:hypothetical protein